MKIWGVLLILPVLLVLLTVAGCGLDDLNRKESIAFGALLAGQAADYFTTIRNLDAGAREFNPILDDHPSNDEVLLFKVVVVGIFWGLGELDPDHQKEWYWLGGILGGGAALFNQYTYEKERP